MHVLTSIRRSIPAPVLAVCAILAGCAAADDGSPGVVVRDSAGVEIVENRMPAWTDDAGWTLADSPRVRIGVVDGDPEYQFFQVRDGILLSDGRIVVLDGGDREFRFYDEAGRFLGKGGAEGAGPGEFGYPIAIHRLPDDRLAVWDARDTRRLVFGPDGSFVRESRTTYDAVGGRFGPDYMIEGFEPLPDGSILARMYERRSGDAPRPTGVFRPRMTFLRLADGGARADTIASVGGIEQMYTEVDGRPSATVLLFGRRAHVAAGGDPLRIYVGGAERYEVRAYSPDGTLERVIRRIGPLPVVRAGHLDSARERRLAWAEGRGRRQQTARALAALPTPATFPAYERLAVDVDGRLWVARYRRPGDTTVAWDVFDRGGRLLGAVEMPARLRPLEIGSDYVLGVRSDALDVQRVVLYDVETGA